MKIFTDSEARQDLSKILVLAQEEEIEIHRDDGAVFSLHSKRNKRESPFDVPGVKTSATTRDILDAIRASRRHESTTPESQ